MASKRVPFYIYLSLFSTSLLVVMAQTDTYIVHMDTSAMPKSFPDHHNWYLATLDSLSPDFSTNSDSPVTSSKLIYSYTHAIHGFSATLTPNELETLKRNPAYVSSTRDLPAKLDTTHSPQFLGLNYNSGAWPVSNFGKDVIIGVVDTGIWPESESFRDTGMSPIPARWKGKCEIGTQFNSSMCNKKLIGARIFNKGLIAKNPNLTFEMNSARDTDGHGTHTSSTATGNSVQGASYFGYATGTATGIAPKARVAVYKALWEDNETSTASDIIAAIDQAIIDGVDVISLSLGFYGSDNLYEDLYNDPISVAAFSAVKKNIFVSTSAGNDGPDGLSLHNGIPWVLTVAAGTMDREFGGVLTLGNKVPIRGMSLYPGNYSSSTEFPIVFLNRCDNQTELDNLGKVIVVCEDADDGFDAHDAISDETYKIRRRPSLAGGIFITNQTDLEFYYRSPFPAIFVTAEDGKTIKDYIKSTSSPKAKMGFRKTFFGPKPAPAVASYSARGPSLSYPYVLKPDILAPGTFVLASWSPIGSAADLGPDLSSLYGKFNVIYGTSMACPHATGLAALLKGAHPEWSPAAIRSAMMTSSDITDNTGGPIKDLGDRDSPAATPFAMGSGHINPNKAMDPGLIYNATIEDYVNMLCALNFTNKQMQIITKTSSNNCSAPSLDLNYPSFIAYYDYITNLKPKLTVEFRRTVTNVGDGMSTYTAKVTGLDGFQVFVTPEKLVFKKKYEEQSFKVSIKGPDKDVDYLGVGYLSWEDEGRKHVVRSPILATTLRLERD